MRIAVQKLKIQYKDRLLKKHLQRVAFPFLHIELFMAAEKEIFLSCPPYGHEKVNLKVQYQQHLGEK